MILARVIHARVSQDPTPPPCSLSPPSPSTISCPSASSQTRWTPRESRLRMTLCPSQPQFQLTFSAVVPSRSRPTEQHARGLQLSREGLVAASSEPLSQKTSGPYRLIKFRIFRPFRYLLQAHSHEIIQWDNGFKRVRVYQTSGRRAFQGH